MIVADVLSSLGLSYEYEARLPIEETALTFVLPDFTVKYEGDTWYWEHLGMLSLPSYAEAWERKKVWYSANGYIDQVVWSEDAPDGSIDARAIEATARQRILQ